MSSHSNEMLVQFHREAARYWTFRAVADRELIATTSNPTPLTDKELVTEFAVVDSMFTIAERELITDLADPKQLGDSCKTLSIEALEKAFPGDAEHCYEFLVQLIGFCKEVLGPQAPLYETEQDTEAHFRRFAEIKSTSNMDNFQANKQKSTIGIAQYVRSLTDKVVRAAAPIETIWTTKKGPTDMDPAVQFHLVVTILFNIVAAPLMYTNMTVSSELVEGTVDTIRKLIQVHPGVRAKLSTLLHVCSELDNRVTATAVPVMLMVGPNGVLLGVPVTGLVGVYDDSDDSDDEDGKSEPDDDQADATFEGLTPAAELTINEVPDDIVDFIEASSRGDSGNSSDDDCDSDDEAAEKSAQ